MRASPPGLLAPAGGGISAATAARGACRHRARCRSSGAAGPTASGGLAGDVSSQLEMQAVCYPFRCELSLSDLVFMKFREIAHVGFEHTRKDRDSNI